MTTHLPVELYTQILTQLPGREPSSHRTVLSFLFANSVTHAAALEKSVWENLYRGRYTHHVEAHENERYARLAGDHRRMYVERYTLDHAALQLVDHIRTHPDDRDTAAHRLISEYSWDVWDALELETVVPIPRAFRDPAVDNMDEEPAPSALPRRFWAKAVLGCITRRHAIDTWARIQRGDEGCTFDDVLLGFSAFNNESPFRILWQLDALAARCRRRLVSEALELDHLSEGYDLARLIVSIREFIHDEGFAVAEDSDAFYASFNQFPHHFLGVGRSKTIPISINYVFAAICRRLGIDAGPTNKPGRVFCHITSPDPQQGDMLFDPCAKTPPTVFSSRDLSVMLSEAGMSNDFSADAVRPAALSTMVNRAIHNIFSTLHNTQRYVETPSGHTMEIVQYAVSTAFATINVQDLHIIPMVSEDCPLDIQAVLIDALLPVIPEDRKEIFMSELQMYTDSRVKYRVVAPRTRSKDSSSIQAFVGEVLLLPVDSLACVIGWSGPLVALEGTPPIRRATCLALTEMGFEDYGTNRWLPAPLTLENLRRLRKRIYMFDRFFEDVHVPREDGIGARLIPVAELQIQYPDDLEAGARWTEEQLHLATT